MKRYAVSEKNTISEQMAEDPLTKALKEEAERMEENANQ
ncbi:unknown [Clostridium sp. CAG:169]|nr:unknown [Clostridium sp. CAG:169]